MTPPISATRRLSACGPPVDEPISNTRGDVVGIGRNVIEGGATISSSWGTIGGADFAIASRLWDVVRCPKGQSPQADLGISPRQCRSHDHNEIGLFLKQ